MGKWKQLVSDVYDDYEIMVNISDPYIEELMADAPVAPPPTEQELEEMNKAYLLKYPDADLDLPF
jgi:hypothetical protein